MAIECNEARENIDAWALGALDADESRLLEEHLSSCQDCTALSIEAEETAASIAMTVPLRQANASLKARVMASAAVLEPAAWANKSAAAARRNSNRYVPTFMAAGLTVFVALAGWGVYAQSEVQDLRGANARVSASAATESSKLATADTQLVQMSNFQAESQRSQDDITDIVSQPDTARLQLEGTAAAPESTGRYVWSPSLGLGALVARKLSPLPEDKTYCLWLVYENGWVLGGLFDVDDEGTGRLIVHEVKVEGTAGALRAFSVTVEPDGDVSRHTGETVMQASLSQP